MKVKDFIKWLEKQDQNLEVCVVEKSTEEDYIWVDGREGEVYEACEVSEVYQFVCFDDPATQSKHNGLTLRLGSIDE